MFTDNIQAFEAHLRSDEKAPATVEKYLRDVRTMAEYCGDDLTRENVIAYKSNLIERYAVRSVKAAIASLNAFLISSGGRSCGSKL